jgi:3-oxoacyl-[acyl-carrier protein] reductase
MDLGLRDKLVVVTGGSSGIGLAAGRMFAEEGARVVLCARRADRLTAARADIAANTGQQVDTEQVDVTKVADLNRLTQVVTERYGRIDVLVNNAGTGTYKPFLEVTDEELVYGMEINFFAQFRLTQRLAPLMISGGGGVVINVSGATGVRVTKPPFRSSCTGPAKAAEVRLSKVLASELGEHGIRVNCVVPGLVYTEDRFAKWEREMAQRELDAQETKATMLEWGSAIPRPGHEWGTVAEIADLIVFAASERSSYVNGATLVIDGGEDKS